MPGSVIGADKENVTEFHYYKWINEIWRKSILAAQDMVEWRAHSCIRIS